MVELPSIVEVADELASGNNLDAYSFAYIDRDQWRASPETTPVFLSTRDDDEDFDDAAGMPIVAARKGLRSLLQSPTSKVLSQTSTRLAQTARRLSSSRRSTTTAKTTLTSTSTKRSPLYTLRRR
jgi:hypothetical protein